MASFHHNSVHQAISMYSVAADMENYLAEGKPVNQNFYSEVQQKSLLAHHFSLKSNLPSVLRPALLRVIKLGQPVGLQSALQNKRKRTHFSLQG